MTLNFPLQPDRIKNAEEANAFKKLKEFRKSVDAQRNELMALDGTEDDLDGVKNDRVVLSHAFLTSSNSYCYSGVAAGDGAMDMRRDSDGSKSLTVKHSRDDHNEVLEWAYERAADDIETGKFVIDYLTGTAAYIVSDAPSRSDSVDHVL